MARTITIDLETAKIIDAAFLPRNPNKLRGDKELARNAANDFKQALSEALGSEEVDAFISRITGGRN